MSVLFQADVIRIITPFFAIMPRSIGGLTGPCRQEGGTLMFRIKGLDHVVLRVRDAGRMLAFYRDVLGCTPERELADIGLVQMRAGAALIDLIAAKGNPLPPAGAGNMDHFCLRVEPFDEAALRRHLESHGVAVGKAESRYGAEGQGPSLYLEDPEGNTVELKGPPWPRSSS
jgi:catechol-2,3-dioxygenase